jgi:hypothetical protein
MATKKETASSLYEAPCTVSTINEGTEVRISDGKGKINVVIHDGALAKKLERNKALKFVLLEDESVAEATTTIEVRNEDLGSVPNFALPKKEDAPA